MSFELSPLLLSVQLALVTVACLLVLGIPLAFWLSESKSKLKPFWEAIISLPLVLPPTVIGFYLLVAFSPNQFAGAWLEEWMGVRLVFSFSGLVVASIIYSFPFMVNPIYSAMLGLPNSLKEASYILGHSQWKTLFRVILPNIKPAILNAIVLSMAHTIGEFGVVLMIGGNIPDKTRVASIAIYDQVEAMNYENAHLYSLILLGTSFSALLVVYLFKQRLSNTLPG